MYRVIGQKIPLAKKYRPKPRYTVFIIHQTPAAKQRTAIAIHIVGTFPFTLSRDIYFRLLFF